MLDELHISITMLEIRKHKFKAQLNQFHELIVISGRIFIKHHI